MPTETLLDLLHEEKKIVKEKHDAEFELMREKRDIVKVIFEDEE